MEDEKRVSGLLKLASQHMKRFHELEEIEWKINFSIWALLGGLAYLWGAGKMTAPTWIKSPSVFLLAPIPAVLLHGAAIFMLSRQHQQAAKMRNHYRDEAARLLRAESGTNAPHAIQSRYFAGQRWRDWCWLGWFMSVTFILTESVLFLITMSRSAP
jgi:hypothetical protein